jgi:hypothetical protein
MADEAQGLHTTRRYYLLTSFARYDEGDSGLGAVWQAKQEALAGTALAADFPSRTTLIAKRYSTLDDLNGADVAELVKRVGLTAKQARAVVAATAAALV